jgi:hypothetical protein
MPPATAGWQQWAGKPQLQIAIHRPVSRLLFSSLPTFDEKTNKLHLHAEKLTETVLHLNLGHVGFLCLCAVLFYFMHPLWWDNYRTTSEASYPGLEAETDTKIIKTKHHCIWTLFSIFHFVLFYLYIYFLFYLFFIFILIFILFIFYFQSSLCLSNVFSAYSWLVHCFSLFISLKLFLFLCFVFYLSTSLFFPFPLTSLLSIPSHLSTKYH